MCDSQPERVEISSETLREKAIVETNAVANPSAALIEANTGHQHYVDRVESSRTADRFANAIFVRHKSVSWHPWAELHRGIRATYRQHNFPTPLTQRLGCRCNVELAPVGYVGGNHARSGWHGGNHRPNNGVGGRFLFGIRK